MRTSRGHVREELLGSLADGSIGVEALGEANAGHLEDCGRCSRLLKAHGRAAGLLAAPWQLVPAGSLVGSRAASASVVPHLRLGRALRAPAPSRRIVLAVALGAAVALLLGLVIGGGGAGPRPEPPVLLTRAGHVHLMNPATEAVVDLGSGGNPSISADGRTIVLVDADRLVSVDVATLARTDLGAWTYEWIAVSRDGHWSILGSGLHLEDRYLLVNNATGVRQALSEPGWKEIGPPAWSPTSNRAVVSANGTQLMVVEADELGPGREHLIGAAVPGAYKGGVTWGAGDRIAYADSLSAGVHVIRPDGSDPRYVAQLVSGAEFPLFLTWSPDGGAVAFAVLSAVGERIELVTLQTGERRVLQTYPDALVDHITWSADGRSLRVARWNGTTVSRRLELDWLTLDGNVTRTLDLGPDIDGVFQ